MIHSSRHVLVLACCGLATAPRLMLATVSANEAGMETAPVILAQAGQFDDATLQAFATAQAGVPEHRPEDRREAGKVPLERRSGSFFDFSALPGTFKLHGLS